MARTRNIKPAFFLNEELAECEPLARLLFAGLWVVADREGRLEYRPKKIKAEILPYDDFDIESLFSQLEKRKFIQIYEVLNFKYIQVLNFKKHQNPHMKEQESTIPAPEIPVLAPDKTGTCPALTLNPYPLTPIPTHGLFEDDFEIFWSAYPKRLGGNAKKPAMQKYTAARKAGVSAELILSGVKAYAAYCRTTGIEKTQYVAQATTWIYQERWNDDYQPPKKETAIDRARRQTIGYTPPNRH